MSGTSALPRLARAAATRIRVHVRSSLHARVFPVTTSIPSMAHNHQYTLNSRSPSTCSPSRFFSTSNLSSHTHPESSTSSSSTDPIDTVNEDEIAKFAAMSDEWWAPHGPFKMLHLMNPPRIRYIRNRLEASGAVRHNQFSSSANNTKYPTSRYPLQGLRILDVGCGGGLLSEALARLGAQVTGLDASNENVQMARIHAQKDPLLNGVDGPGSVQYIHSLAEKLMEEGKQFDVVCSMEVIEHVDNPAGFLQCLGQLVRPGGDLLLSTISRTPFAYLMTIFSAEHLLRMVPVGTHHYEKYIRPEELEKGVKDLTGCIVLDVQGIGFNPVAGQWQLLPKSSHSPFFDGENSDDAGLLGRVVGTLGLSEASNYFLAAKKPRAPAS